VFSTWYLGVFGAIQLYLSGCPHFLVCVMMCGIYILIDFRLSEDIYKQVGSEVGTDPYIIGMSVFLGYYAFDLQGIFYGPLLTCLVPIIQKHMVTLK
jgi:hypothetical protein